MIIILLQIITILLYYIYRRNKILAINIVGSNILIRGNEGTIYGTVLYQSKNKPNYWHTVLVSYVPLQQ